MLVLLFGASKLPELARGSGRALRIFKAETKGLMDDDDDDDASPPTPRGATTPSGRPSSASSRPARRSLDAESERQAAERRAAEHRGDDPV